MLNKKLVLTLLKIILIAFVLSFIIFPIFYGFIFSNFNIVEENKINNDSLYPSSWGFENYLKAFNDGFLNSFLFTFIYIIIIVSLRLIISLTAGYVLSSQKNKSRKYFFVFLLITAFIPEYVLLIGILDIFNNQNVDNIFVDTFMLAAPSVFSLFTILIFRDAFLSISKDDRKNMLMDNLSFFKKISVVYLPKLNLAITLTTIITAAGAWNSYLWPSIYLFGKSNQTLSTWVFTLGSLPQGGVSEAIKLAGTFLYIFPVITIYVLTHRKIIKSFKKIK